SEEYLSIQRHTIEGYEIIKNCKGSSHRQALVVLQHHERENGTGYPFNQKANDIDIHSKIVAVADVFHAMISKRPYKDPISIDKVKHEISLQAYSTLEQSIAFTLLALIDGKHVVISNV